jgi:Icc-related predicted phosphoesterase
LKELLLKIRFTGSYYVILDRGEESKFAAESEREKLFTHVLVDATREWIQLAEERLKDSETICLIMPGNDDPRDIDSVLGSSSRIINPDGKLIAIDGTYEIASSSFGNITPWSCPRDIQEDELETKLEIACSAIKSPETALFNFHVPPYDSGLDLAPKLDADLKIVTEMGQPVMIPVGSHAVRKIIEKYQPLVGLHGHIHESKGTTTIGRTFCVNPGSEYAEGLLHGAVLDLEKGKLRTYVLTQG